MPTDDEGHLWQTEARERLGSRRRVMHEMRRPVIVGPLIGAVLLALAMVVASASASDTALVFILIVGLVGEAALYGVLFIAQRRRHW
jgi:hypothetical protein